MTYLLPHFSSLFPIYVFLSFLIHHSQRSNTSLHKYLLLSMTLGCLLLYLFFFIYEKFENTFFPHCDIAIFLPWSLCCFQIRQIYQWLWASCRWCNRKPIGLRQDADHRTATLMSSVTPFVCGAPLYLWQALHFLSSAGRVFAARWFQGFRALCPYSTPLFDIVDRKSRGGGAMQTGRRREGD